MTTTIDVSKTQPTLSELVKKAQAGDEVILSDGSTPVARLVAIPVTSRSSTRVAGLHRGKIETRADFDEPLPDEFWAGAQ